MTDKDYIKIVVKKGDYKSLMEEVLKTFSKLGYFVEIKEENK
jgi:hypothetical protein